MIADSLIWTVIVLLGLGTFGIRFSFLGLLGNRRLPEWALLHLKYVAVAVFPALVAPLVLWPEASGGEDDPARVLAALAAVLIGIKFPVWATLFVGMAALYLMQFLLS